MQTASSKIWTQVAVSISCDANHYTTNARSMYVFVYVRMCVYVCMHICEVPDIGLMSRVFANGLRDLGSIPGRVVPKTKKNGTWCLLV